MSLPASAPLEGIRVLDMADEKGELCGRLLADLGADVVRVEPLDGATSRRLPPFAPDGTSSLYFAFRNANKRGITLDPTLEAGRELLHRLLDQSDIWIESSAPAFLDAHGLAPAAIRERHPALVHTSITDFGHTGPRRDYQGTDMIGFAMGGMMHRCGAAHRPPVVAPGALAYDTAGVTAGFATLLAYYHRLKAGRGQHLDVSVEESVANLSDWALPGYSQSKLRGKRDGFGIYPLIPCADGFVRVIIIAVHHWRALRAWLGEPKALQDPELDSFVGRIVRRGEIEPEIVAFFEDKKKIDIAREAQQRGITITPLLDPSETLSNEHALARQTFRTMEILPGVEAQVASGLYEIDGERMGPRERAPRVGEHNQEVYTALGVSAGELDDLRSQGVI